MMTTSKKKAMGAFGVVGVGLMLSSTAYACSVYKGKLTASGNGAGNVTQTVYGTGTGMNWCTPLPTPTVKVAATTGTISLATAGIVRGESSKRCGVSVMVNGTYAVGVTPGGSGHMPQGGGSGAAYNCHGSTSHVIIANGTVSGGVFGSSSVSWNTTALSARGPSSVCIYKTGGGADAIAINIDQV